MHPGPATAAYSLRMYLPIFVKLITYLFAGAVKNRKQMQNFSSSCLGPGHGVSVFE